MALPPSIAQLMTRGMWAASETISKPPGLRSGGDEPLRIMERMRHRDLKTTMSHVRTAQELGDEFGETFPTPALRVFDSGHLNCPGAQNTVEMAEIWRPQGDLNPCYRRERPMS
jgi:hypothetical protein